MIAPVKRDLPPKKNKRVVNFTKLRYHKKFKPFAKKLNQLLVVKQPDPIIVRTTTDRMLKFDIKMLERFPNLKTSFYHDIRPIKTKYR